MKVKIKEIEYIDPLQLLLGIKENKYHFILESLGKTDRRARFTFLGCNPAAIINVGNNGTKIDVFKDIKGIDLYSGEIKEKNPFNALDLLYKDIISDIKKSIRREGFFRWFIRSLQVRFCISVSVKSRSGWDICNVWIL